MLFNFGWVIINVVGLLFIGLGVKLLMFEWGIMVVEGVCFIFIGKWWLVVYFGLVLMFVVLCFNLFGDGLCDIFDLR